MGLCVPWLDPVVLVVFFSSGSFYIFILSKVELNSYKDTSDSSHQHGWVVVNAAGDS